MNHFDPFLTDRDAGAKIERSPTGVSTSPTGRSTRVDFVLRDGETHVFETDYAKVELRALGLALPRDVLLLRKSWIYWLLLAVFIAGAMCGLIVGTMR